MNLRLITAIFVLSLSIAPMVHADLNVSSIGTVYTIDFDTAGVTDTGNGVFAGSGFQSTPTAGQLDSDTWAVTGVSDGNLAFGGTRTTANTDYTRGASNGGVGTGGIYSFDVDNDNTSGIVDRALGMQPKTGPGGGGTDFVPGTITLRVKNPTANSFGSWSIAYDVFAFNDTAFSSTVNFSYSTDDLSYTPLSLDFASTTTAAGTPNWVSVEKSAAFPANVAPNGNLYLRWSISSTGTGNNNFGDEIALDNIRVSAVPEPSAFLFGGLIAGVIGFAAGGKKLAGKLRKRNAA